MHRPQKGAVASLDELLARSFEAGHPFLCHLQDPALDGESEAAGTWPESLFRPQEAVVGSHVGEHPWPASRACSCSCQQATPPSPQLSVLAVTSLGSFFLVLEWDHPTISEICSASAGLSSFLFPRPHDP